MIDFNKARKEDFLICVSTKENKDPIVVYKPTQETVVTKYFIEFCLKNNINENNIMNEIEVCCLDDATLN